MTNLIGAEADDWPTLAAEPGARLHLYGKREARPGRKMGHVNRVSTAQFAVRRMRKKTRSKRADRHDAEQQNELETAHG